MTIRNFPQRGKLILTNLIGREDNVNLLNFVETL